MTNNEIISIFKREHNLKRIIEKNITKSSYDDSSSDLEMYIYECLLRTNNMKLNSLYNKKQLIKYIIGMIKNERNYYASKYNKYFSFKDCQCYENLELLDEETDIIERQEEEDKQDKIEAVLLNFFKNTFWTGSTEEDKENFIAINFLSMKLGVEINDGKLYLIKGMSKIELAKDYVDRNINKNNLKTRTYLINKYITKAIYLLTIELEKNKYI